ncbi:MAG: helix-hairpin-helix domain-containing protein [Bacteroidia bacterium]|nr:helix-hairpin-helix domain-containing protein [Bacteroidia bacterium]
MNNLIIAEQFHRLSKLMELHQENPFKVKAISNAASIIEKLNQDINEHNYKDLATVKGIGKNILEKVYEILSLGKIKELEILEKNTPKSVIELLNIKGLGASKVYKIWKNLNIEHVEQLIDAAEKNKLIELKGFSEKTQQSILENARFYLQNKNKLQLGHALSVVHIIQNILNENKIDHQITGEVRRQCETITKIEFIVHQSIPDEITEQIHKISSVPVIFHYTKKANDSYILFQTTGSKEFLNEIGFSTLHRNNYKSEEEIFQELNCPFVLPPQRESIHEYYLISKQDYSENPIEIKDIKGILHCHTAYSDGLHTVKEMADFCKQENYQYLGICDHSQSAKYANGLEPERLLKQIEEIDKYNQNSKNFKIFKGIESDILKDGSLDYEPSILKQLDFVVASVHSHFDMTEKQATDRIIKAIENPYTTILGHLTGRLLLIRKGYPVNHKKIIDACAENKVVIELNANTYRLDIDWRWLKYCCAKNVKIAINPDAHSTTAIRDVLYGVMVAQKAGVEKEHIINTYPAEKIYKVFHKEI